MNNHAINTHANCKAYMLLSKLDYVSSVGHNRRIDISRRPLAPQQVAHTDGTHGVDDGRDSAVVQTQDRAGPIAAMAAGAARACRLEQPPGSRVEDGDVVRDHRGEERSGAGIGGRVAGRDEAGEGVAAW